MVHNIMEHVSMATIENKLSEKEGELNRSITGEYRSTCILGILPVYWGTEVYLYTGEQRSTCILGNSGLPVYWGIEVYLYTGE